MDNHTALHIEDFCVDDSVDNEEAHIELSKETQQRKNDEGRKENS